jgi:Tfp pilus assembly protein FimT
MKSKKGLTVVEAAVVVSLMVILALTGVYSGQNIIREARTTDCVSNLGMLYNLKRIAFNVNAVNIPVTVDGMIGAYPFCTSSDSEDDRYSQIRYLYDYNIQALTEDAMPLCKSLGGLTPQVGHEIN